MDVDDFYCEFEDAPEFFDLGSRDEPEDSSDSGSDEIITQTVMQKIEIYLEEKNLLSNIIDVFD